ncbi:putative cupin superfamily protein [Sphingobium fontiphilum]|uniref:Putative cupin superfamily protein n=1 Tax=Sphingobium fontiphilum TaxID=944425 RepID=A0A7W6GNS9_9SPHN|nr:cupin domain-containing protein [Sphingobium fontiphilum]MBB3982130.1 putative cupin superfamily protein [Sphingobium fontiphilum]
MPIIAVDAIEQVNRTGYPAPHDAAVAGRWYRRLGEAFGLRDFGVSHVVLRPGAASSHRHWHEEEDEFVVILSGEAVLVDDDGRHPMRAGAMAAFPKGQANGHHLVNESGQDCAFLAFGRPPAGPCHYSDIDMMWDGAAYRRKDGGGF